MTDDAFFLPDGPPPGGDRDGHDPSGATRSFVATGHTRGPWDPGAQHGGPPCALIGHVLETDHVDEQMQFARLSFEILRPVPVGRLHVTTAVLRGGRRVELLEATLSDDGGTPLVLARAWRIRTADLPLGHATTPPPGPAATGPEAATAATSFFRQIDHEGYVQAMEVRFASGGWAEPGPATAWLRMRHPLLPGVPPSPLVRTLIAADSGNGVSAAFEGIFINPELTVHLTRPPIGEWICLQAATTLTDHGIGLAETVLHDTGGPFGRGSQSLLLDVLRP